MKNASLLLILALPVFLSAQGRGRPGAPDQLTLSSEFSGRDGFNSRSAGFTSAFSMGRLGNFDLSATAAATHHRTWDSAWFPGEVYDTGLRLKAKGRKWSFGAGLSSDSDRPFNSPSETDLSLDASVPLSRRGPHAFTLGLMYSSRRSFLRNIPLPYIAYSYFSEDLTIFFPFALHWRITENSDLDASYFPPKYFSISLTERVFRGVSIAAYSGIKLDQYLLAGRPDKDLSLFLERPYAGLRTTLKHASGCELSLSTGWGFKGRGFSGKSFDDRRSEKSAGAGPELGIALKKAFGSF